MVQRNADLRSRIVGAELRRRREQAGLDAVQIAHWLSWSQTKISHMEHGNRGISETDAAMYLASCRTRGQELQDVLEFFQEHGDHWVQPHGVRLSDELLALTALETTAARIDWFEQLIVPGLLQTAAYMRGLFYESGLIPAAHVEPLIRARKARQAVLHRKWPPKCTFYIHEFATRLEVGDAAVMNDQLLHLVFSSDLPHISIRVIPASAGPHAGLGGPFAVLEHKVHKPAVYVEMETASLFITRPDTVSKYEDIRKRLAAVALDEGESRSWLAQRASEFDRPREDRHAHPTSGDPVA
jgi:hypothetical protein